MSPLLECGSHSSWRQVLVPGAFFCSPFYSACDANPWDGIIHAQGVSYLLSSHAFGTTLTDMPRDMCQGIPKPSQVDEGDSASRTVRAALLISSKQMWLCVKTLEDTLLSCLVSELFSFRVTCLSYFLSAPGVISTCWVGVTSPFSWL